MPRGLLKNAVLVLLVVAPSASPFAIAGARGPAKVVTTLLVTTIWLIALLWPSAM